MVAYGIKCRPSQTDECTCEEVFRLCYKTMPTIMTCIAQDK